MMSSKKNQFVLFDKSHLILRLEFIKLDATEYVLSYLPENDFYKQDIPFIKIIVKD